MIAAELGLAAAMNMVNDFHREVVSCPQQPLTPGKFIGPLEDVSEEMSDAARDLLEAYKRTGNQAYVRAHLIVEETGELLNAMSCGNEVAALDALADLLYVVLGTAVTLGLPLPEAFVAVHESNMTKKRQADDPDGARVRAKGEGYVTPDLANVLAKHRERYRGDDYQVRPVL